MPQGRLGLGVLDARYESSVTRNIIDYGADPSGSDMSTDAINAAISACSAGDAVLIPPGKFLIDDEIEVNIPLTIEGKGSKSQIVQTAEATAIKLATNPVGGVLGFAYSTIANLAVGSRTQTAGTALLHFEDTPYNLIDNVWLGGGYYGVWLEGALGNTLRHLSNAGTLLFGESLGNTEYVLFAERAFGKSVNHTNLINPFIQQNAVNGVYYTDTNGEGGLNVIGGIIEGLTGSALYVSGLRQLGIFEGTHYECTAGHADNNTVDFVGSANFVCRGNFFGSPVNFTSCSRFSVTGARTNYVTVGSDCDKFTVQDSDYNTLSILGTNGKLRNLVSQSSVYLGGYGKYTHERPASLTDSIGDLETWAGGAPSGFSVVGAAGTVTQESTIVSRGSSSAKITRTASQCGLSYTLDVGKYRSGASITVSFWAYKPASNGFNPRAAAVYNGWSSTTSSPTFSLTAATWTPCVVTFHIPASLSSGLILIGEHLQGSAANSICYIDDIIISEVQF